MRHSNDTKLSFILLNRLEIFASDLPRRNAENLKQKERRRAILHEAGADDTRTLVAPQSGCFRKR
jgi:hypothetical protein